MDGWVGGWLENEFLKKTPSPKLDLSPCLGLSTLEFVNIPIFGTFIGLFSQFSRIRDKIPIFGTKGDYGVGGWSVSDYKA